MPNLGVYECTPECDVSVDESLMVWKGHLSWKVYISSKRATFGRKSYESREAKVGYIWNFIIYLGQDTVFESPKNETYGSKVVLQLMAPLRNLGYHIIMDNWFSNPGLFCKLCSRQTGG
jgi:hypothetical protein